LTTIGTSGTLRTVTWRFCTAVSGPGSDTVTCTRYTLSAFASPGASKFGALTKVSTPVAGTIEKSA
jgi:hypothetical protein